MVLDVEQSSTPPHESSNSLRGLPVRILLQILLGILLQGPRVEIKGPPWMVGSGVSLGPYYWKCLADLGHVAQAEVDIANQPRNRINTNHESDSASKIRRV